MERQAPTHRVADVGPDCSRVSEQFRSLEQVGANGSRSAVAGRIDQDHLMIAGQTRGDCRPRPSGLGEAMDEHDAGPDPERLGVEHHSLSVRRRPWH